MKKHLLAVAVLSLAAGGAFAQSSATIKKIMDGSVTLGVRESSGSLSQTLGGGKFVGYHVELCEDIVKSINPKVNITYTPVTSANRIPLVQNGTVDIECGSTTNNEARQKDVSFLLTTYVTEVRTAVKKSSGIKSIADFEGKTIATTTGTTSVALIRKNKRGSNLKFNEVYGKDHADSFLLLESGRADAFVMDDNLLAGLIANAKSPADYAIVGETLNIEPIAIMVRKDDPEFKKKGDDVIRAKMKDGSLAKLYDKWFMQPIPPKNVSVNLPMGDTLKELMKAPNDKPAEAYAAK